MPELNYTQQAQNFIRDALKLISEGAKESRIRENFTSYLRLMFPPQTKWVNDHISQGETTVRLNRRGNIVSGFIDNCIDNIAIEYEKNLNLKSVFDEGFIQVKEYCAAFANKGIDCGMIAGILSDTINWYVYKIQEPTLSAGDYTKDNIKLKLIDELHITDHSVPSAEKLLQFLKKNLGKIGGRKLSAESLSNDFGLTSKYTSHYIREVIDFVESEISINPGYYALIKKLWCTFVDVESSDNGSSNEDRTLLTYSSEFYISIIAKILAANILAQKAIISDQRELFEIISGVYFENQGIFNFAEYDYFGWISDNNISKIESTLHRIQHDLSVYDYSGIGSGDLFGSLLVQLANKHHRLLLGQELTPSWLSKKVVEHTIRMLPENEMPRFVDMCCGSGSMLVATIEATKRMCSRLSPELVADSVVSCATGFDIDPLATILAKVNWIVNVADVVDFSKGVYIPVYHSDSLFISSLAKNVSGDYITVELHDKTVNMPQSMLNEDFQQIFDVIVNKCHDLIGVEITKESLDCFIDSIWNTSDNQEERNKVKNAAYQLYRAMNILEKEGINGLWAFVLKNSLRPSLIRESFNGIVSNTPWLAMSKIADNPYKQQLRLLARKYNLLPTGSSSLHLELSTIFLISSINRYLMPDGVFGCIVPHSVLNGNHHVALRLGRFKDAPTPVDADFTNIWLLDENVFKNKAIVLFGRKTPYCQKSELQGTSLSSAGESPTTFKVKTSGAMTIWTNDYNGKERINYNFYHFSQGADIMPRALFFFNLEDNGLYFNISKIRQSSVYAYFLKDMKAAKDFSPENISVPKSRFFPVLVSHSLTPFTVSCIPKALLPVKKNNDGVWTELSDIDRSFLERPIQHLFNSVYDAYSKTKNGKSLYNTGLNMRNKLSSQHLCKGDIVVVYGAGGSRTCAAYFEITDDIPEIIIDQTIYYYITRSEDEALYLTGMLNSTAVAEANSAYQSEGILGRRHIHTLPASSIPQYNPSDIYHKEMVIATSKLKYRIEKELPQEWLQPNYASITWRRSRIYRFIDSLPEYRLTNDMAFKILDIR